MALNEHPISEDLSKDAEVSQTSSISGSTPFDNFSTLRTGDAMQPEQVKELQTTIDKQNAADLPEMNKQMVNDYIFSNLTPEQQENLKQAAKNILENQSLTAEQRNTFSEVIQGITGHEVTPERFDNMEKAMRMTTQVAKEAMQELHPSNADLSSNEQDIGTHETFQTDNKVQEVSVKPNQGKVVLTERNNESISGKANEMPQGNENFGGVTNKEERSDLARNLKDLNKKIDGIGKEVTSLGEKIEKPEKLSMAQVGKNVAKKTAIKVAKAPLKAGVHVAGKVKNGVEQGAVNYIKSQADIGDGR